MPPATVGITCTWCPIAASFARTASGTACSTSSALPSVQTRGASTASCRLMPWSIRLISACIALGKIRFPPGRPSAKRSLPFCSAIIGDIEVVTRLPGASDNAWPGRGS
jgi:hypothetical protein